MNTRGILLTSLALAALTLACSSKTYTEEEKARGEHCERQGKYEVEQRLKRELHDPGSYEYDFTYTGPMHVNIYEEDYGPAFEVSVHYRAKNAFGALRKGSMTGMVLTDCTWVGVLENFTLRETDKLLFESAQSLRGK